jgi:hypothetical protein
MKGEILMRKHKAILILASALVVAVGAAPALYAQTDQKPAGSMMRHGMMRDHSGHDGMMSMMKGMQRMGEMMDHCASMMGNARPNDQWRNNAPSEPEKRG